MSKEDKVKIDTITGSISFTDNKVEQINTTTGGNYRLLFSSTADDEDRTEGARKASSLLFNPATGDLTAPTFVGDLTGNASSATKLENDAVFTVWGNTFFQNGKPKDIYWWNTAKMQVINFIGNDSVTTAGYIGRGSGLSDDIYLLASEGNSLRLGSNNNISLFINTSGNVGIGNTSPTYKLDVQGAVKADLYRKSTASSNRVMCTHDGESLIFGDTTDRSYLRGSEIRFQNAVGTTVVSIINGNLLIGTTTDNGTKLHVAGNISATNFIGNLDGTYINALTGYTKATAISALAETDTLNTALGKLEYKADVTYNLVKGAYDGDGTIENLEEILRVLEGISDTDTIQAIVGKYLPLTGGTVTGPVEIKSTSSGDYNEGLRISVASNNWAGITFGSTGLAGAPTNGWFVALNPSDQFIITPNSSSNTTGLTLNSGGNALWRNNVLLHTGNYSSTLDGRYYTETEVNNLLAKYLPLTGGTMALGEGLKFHADGNYFGTNSDARIISLLDDNGTTCDGGLIIDERATYNGTEYITELLRIKHDHFAWKGNTIWHAGNDGSGSGLDADLLDGINSTGFLRKVTVSNNAANDFNSFENMTLTGRGDPASGCPALVNAPWSGSGPAGGYGVLTYLWSGYGTQMAWGYNSNRIYIRNRYYSSGHTWSSTWDSLALTSDIPTVTNYYWANVPISATSNATTTPTFNGVYASFMELSRTSDHGLKVGAIRGTAVGSRTGEYIHMYERVHIGSPSGWGSNDAPANGLSTYGGAWFAVNNGNVGIGTTSPTQKLTVNGNIAFTSTGIIGASYSASDTTMYNSITINNSTGGIQYKSGSWTSGDHVAHNFLTGSSNSRLAIRNNGNVGIGTDSPAHKLDVRGRIFSLTSDVDGVIIKRQTAGSGAFIRYLSDNQDAKGWRVGMLGTQNDFTFEYSTDTFGSTSQKLCILKNGGLISPGHIIIKGSTSSVMTYDGNVHGALCFENSDSSQNIRFIFTEHDTYRSPAGIKLVGNQGGEWFEVVGTIYGGSLYSTDTIETGSYITFGTYGARFTSDIRNSWRTSIYGNTTTKSRLRTVRTDVTIDNFSEIYGSGLTWATGDTQGYLSVSYSSGKAWIGGGAGNSLGWSTYLVTGNNIGSQSVDYANTAGSASDSDKLGGRTSGKYVWNIQESDFDPSDVVGNYVGMSTQTGISSNWTHILSFDWRSSGTSKISGGANSSWETQLALPTQNRNGLYYRSFSSNAPHDWIKVIDSGNYTSYTVKKDGTGASGTWGINITGSAAYLPITSGITTETSITESGLRVYSGSGSGWTGEVTSMAYAGIIALGTPSRGFQMWAKRGTGTTGSLRFRVGNDAANAWESVRTILDDNNWTSFISVPSVGNGTVTITQNGANMGSFTMNQSSNTTIALNNTNTNYYPTAFSWTAGSTAGPTGSLSGSGMSAVSFGAIPSASSTASGIVTTGDQYFAGQKTFYSGLVVYSTNKAYFNYSSTYAGNSNYVAGSSTTNLSLNGYSSMSFAIAGSTKLQLTSSSLNPQTSGGITLGTTSLKFGNVYAASIGTSSYRCTYGYFSNAVYAASGFYESSDERLKSILNPVKVDLDELSKLRKVYYIWKDASNTSVQLGMIAQDVQKLYPELVDVDKETGYLSLAYDKLSVIALEAIDNIYNTIKDLKKENLELKSRIEKLEKLL